MSDSDRRARWTAQFDQAAAEGRDAANDPELRAVTARFVEATNALCAALLEAGIPPEGLMAAVLGPTAELIIRARDD